VASTVVAGGAGQIGQTNDHVQSAATGRLSRPRDAIAARLQHIVRLRSGCGWATIARPSTIILPHRRFGGNLFFLVRLPDSGRTTGRSAKRAAFGTGAARFFILATPGMR